MTKMIFILVALMVPLEALAQQDLLGTTVRRITVGRVPTYFFRATPDSKYLGFTIASHSNMSRNNNYLLDMKTEKAQPIPGMFDPVFMANSRLMVTPLDNGYNYAFYRIQDLVKDGLKAIPVFLDAEISGYYQSVGMLSEKGNITTYRLLMESSGLLYRDYEETRSPDGTSTIKPISDRQRLCAGFAIKLPILSKNGREVAGIVDSENSKIFSIGEDGTCTIKEDLGMKTGKVAFSYDGTKVAFHVFHSDDPELTDSYVELPSSDVTSDIYIYDRATKVRRQMTKNKEHNSMYPDFLANGNVIFINHPHDSTVGVSFIEIKP